MHHMKARLLRDVPVCLLDFSLSGCCVATNHPLGDGTVGELRVILDGKEYRDTIEVLRTSQRHGVSPTFVAGGHFAWGNRPGTASIRDTVPALTPLYVKTVVHAAKSVTWRAR